MSTAKKTARRIYLVNSQNDARLVRATTAAQAIGHVTRNTYTAKPATQQDLVDALGVGVQVEEAGADAVAAE